MPFLILFLCFASVVFSMLVYRLGRNGANKNIPSAAAPEPKYTTPIIISILPLAIAIFFTLFPSSVLATQWLAILPIVGSDYLPILILYTLLCYVSMVSSLWLVRQYNVITLPLYLINIYLGSFSLYLTISSS